MKLQDSTVDRYDVVVIGAGIAGLAGATRLAKEGKKVLLIEQHFKAGGYCTSFRRKGFTFVLTGNIASAGPGGAIGRILKGLGVHDRLEIIKYDYACSYVFPGLSVALPETWDEAIAKLKETFPQDEKGIDWFFSTAAQIDSNTAPPEVTKQCLTTPIDNMLAGRISDMRLRSCLAGIGGSPGTSPQKRVIADCMSIWARTRNAGGRYSAKGGCHRLPETLAKIFTETGGSIKYRTKAAKIIVEGGKVKGVEFKNGSRAMVPVVLSASDARSTFLDLVGKDNLPADFAQMIGKRKAGLSCINVWLGLDIDPISRWGISPMSYVHTTPSLTEAYNLLLEGKFGERMSVICDTALEPSLAPKGYHTIRFFSLAAYDCPDVDWKADKARITQRMISKAEELLPELSKHIVVQEASTPATNIRYTSNYMGAMASWDSTPENMGKNALQQETPIEGLYLAGNWTVPGHGIPRCLTSGWQAAEMILSRG